MKIHRLNGLPSIGLMIAMLLQASACGSGKAPQPAATNEQVVLTDRVAALARKSKADLVFVQGGVFQMGDFGRIDSPEKLLYTGQRAATPLHEVELDSYSISRFKVTYEDFDVYTDAKGLPRIAMLPFDKPYRMTPNVPAGVNWPEAKAYCGWLEEITGLPFDLPTEAQWEYAARNRGQFVQFATDNGAYNKGRNVASLEQYEQMMSTIDSIPAVHPIGRFPPSPLGLYDMGLVGKEWVEDWFDEDYYEHSPRLNPKGPAAGTMKVQRGIESREPVTATTMYRQKQVPTIPIFNSSTGDGPMSDRWARSVFRCVVNKGSSSGP